MQQQYLPIAGDRIAVQAFCNQQTSHSPRQSKQQKLLATLRKKLMLKRKSVNSAENSEESDKESDSMPKSKKHFHLTGNSHAAKQSRKVEIGWLNYESGRFIQVRKKRGGGTRRVDISKSATQSDILAIAKSSFFHQGTSPLGKEDEFTFSVSDFAETAMGTSEETVAEIYERTHMKILRFYMATERKAAVGNLIDTEQKSTHSEELTPSSSRSKARAPDPSTFSLISDDETLAGLDISSSLDPNSTCTVPEQVLSSVRSKASAAESRTFPLLSVDETLPDLNISTVLDNSDGEVFFNFKDVAPSTNVSLSFYHHPVDGLTSTIASVSNAHLPTGITQSTAISSLSETMLQDSIMGRLSQAEASGQLPVKAEALGASGSTSNSLELVIPNGVRPKAHSEHQVLPAFSSTKNGMEQSLAIGIDAPSIPFESFRSPAVGYRHENSEISELILSEDASSQPEDPIISQEMVIHRGAGAFKELIGYFKDPDIAKKQLSIIRVLPNGEREMAEDTGGVLRDLLSDFWEDFYTKCTLGRIMKVPCLRHDFGVEEWRAVGRILSYGWDNAGYWPTRLAKSFINHCIYPGIAPQTDDLLEDFYNYLSIVDTEVFRKAVDKYEEVDQDELLDALDSHDCRTQVSANNVKCILLEMTHKELIQIPKFVSDCWHNSLLSTGMNAHKLETTYQSLLPTNKKVVQMLEFPNSLNNPMIETVKFLKRYVKELTVDYLERFLRFCTGANLITVEKIKIDFVDLKGLSRRPVSHTCGCLLELPTNYENFMEFRTEFDGVLGGDIWVMDIV